VHMPQHAGSAHDDSQAGYASSQQSTINSCYMSVAIHTPSWESPAHIGCAAHFPWPCNHALHEAAAPGAHGPRAPLAQSRNARSAEGRCRGCCPPAGTSSSGLGDSASCVARILVPRGKPAGHTICCCPLVTWLARPHILAWLRLCHVTTTTYEHT
jgi:hypothetical protein